MLRGRIKVLPVRAGSVRRGSSHVCKLDILGKWIVSELNRGDLGLVATLDKFDRDVVAFNNSSSFEDVVELGLAQGGFDVCNQGGAAVVEVEVLFGEERLDDFITRGTGDGDDGAYPGSFGELDGKEPDSGGSTVDKKRNLLLRRMTPRRRKPKCRNQRHSRRVRRRPQRHRFRKTDLLRDVKRRIRRQQSVFRKRSSWVLETMKSRDPITDLEAYDITAHSNDDAGDVFAGVDGQDAVVAEGDAFMVFGVGGGDDDFDEKLVGRRRAGGVLKEAECIGARTGLRDGGLLNLGDEVVVDNGLLVGFRDGQIGRHLGE